MREDSGAPAGRENASYCQAAGFPTRSREHDTSELSKHEICDTNTEVLWERQGYGKNSDQELKNGEDEKRLEGGKPERSTHHPGPGRMRHDSRWRWKKHHSEKSHQQGGQG